MNESKRISVHMGRGETMTGWVYLPLYLLVLPVALEYVFLALGMDISSAAGKARVNGVFFVVNFLCCLVIFRKFLLGNLLQLTKRFWGFVQAVILALVMYFALTWLVNLVVVWILPELVNFNNEQIFAMARENQVIMVIGTVVLAPMAEECLFRGLIFQNIHRKNRILAYAVTSLVFSFIHVMGYIGKDWTLLLGNAVCYLPAGVALGWAYEKADSIFAAMTVHCIINAIGMGISL